MEYFTSNPSVNTLFWSLIFALALLCLAMLALYWIFQNQKMKSKVDFALLAQQLHINAYGMPKPYAAGVYQGRGVLLQPGNGTGTPPVAVFCDNPRRQVFVMHPHESRPGFLGRWSRPSFKTDAAFETLFNITPAKEKYRLLNPAVRASAAAMAAMGLRGRVELQGRTIAYVEAESECLSTMTQYLVVLELCLALSLALEMQTAPSFPAYSVLSGADV